RIPQMNASLSTLAIVGLAGASGGAVVAAWSHSSLAEGALWALFVLAVWHVMRHGGTAARLALAPSRAAYLVALGGGITVNGVAAAPRDGVAVSGEAELVLRAEAGAEVVMVEVRA
ncbi:MAG: hypothetical protein ACP5NP_09590, partial [Acetobacteraceae bacterium]